MAYEIRDYGIPQEEASLYDRFLWTVCGPLVLFICFSFPLFLSDYSSTNKHVSRVQTARLMHKRTAASSNIDLSVTLDSASGKISALWDEYNSSDRTSRRKLILHNAMDKLTSAARPVVKAMILRRVAMAENIATDFKGVARGEKTPGEFFHNLPWGRILFMSVVHVF